MMTKEQKQLRKLASVLVRETITGYSGVAKKSYIDDHTGKKDYFWVPATYASIEQAIDSLLSWAKD